MKKISFLICLTTLSSICIFSILSCNKVSDLKLNTDFVIEKNKPITILKDDGVSVTAIDIYSKKTSFRREITINGGINKEELAKIYITFTSSDNTNIYQMMISNPKSVNGEFTIETEGQVILKKKIKNGIWEMSEILTYKPMPPNYNPKVPCAVSTIVDCIEWKLNDMNWIEYGGCCISAPACYANLWASCTWEVCHNHMQYTNPN